MRAFHLRSSVVATLAVSVILACHKAAPETAAPKPQVHPLAGIVGQALIIAPIQAVRFAPELGWTALPGNSATAAALDTVLGQALSTRVGNQQWIYFDALTRSAANNPGYATNPRSLGITPLRAPRWKVGDRLPEPLATQLRTMIALQDARLVFLPVELRFDRTPAGLGRPVVHLVLVDPRASVIQWIGDVTGDDLPAFTPAYSALIADRIADLFVDK